MSNRSRTSELVAMSGTAGHIHKVRPIRSSLPMAASVNLAISLRVECRITERYVLNNKKNRREKNRAQANHRTANPGMPENEPNTRSESRSETKDAPTDISRSMHSISLALR